DGFLDLYVTNYLDFELNRKVRRSRLSAREGYQFFPGPRDYAAQADVLYHNNGDGTFTDVTKQAGVFRPEGKGMQPVFADFDDDGDADIYVANDRTPNFLYINQGNGRFEETALTAGVALDENGNETGAMGVTLGDFDADGLADLLVTNMVFEYNALYRNAGDGTFRDVTKQAHIAKKTYPFVGWGTGFFDYDNDGDLDIFFANGHVQDYINVFSESVTYAQPNLLFANRGDGTFREVSGKSGLYFSARDVSRGMATGDYDNDGDADIVISNLNARPVLLRNEAANHNHWLMVDLVGRRSNRDGIGAKVKVITGGRVQSREMRSGSSYLSQNDRRLHFGLGGQRKVDAIEVRWPGGKTETFKNLGSDRLFVVTEGEGLHPTPAAGSTTLNGKLEGPLG
ncbi:MAG: CRTAC1 family protein, partial [Acidobacteriota bacterium]